MTGIRILGTGSYLPETIVTNEDFTGIVETSDEWITTRTGIKSRHFAEETVWYMGEQAARCALEKAGVAPQDVDLIIVTTVTPDYITPSVSCMIQARLGAADAMCMDVNCACAGFVYATDMARRYLCTGDLKTALVISSEVLSRVTDFSDRGTCVLFGDGAGAAVLTAGEGAYGAKIGADGTGAALMFGKHDYKPSPFTKKPLMQDEISQHPAGTGYLVMNGKEVYKYATRTMAQSMAQACGQAGISVGDLAWIIPHQANVRIVQTAMKYMGLPMDKAYINIDHVGNTSSATIPIALNEMADAGKLRKGDKIGIMAVGAGLTYGSAVFEW